MGRRAGFALAIGFCLLVRGGVSLAQIPDPVIVAPPPSVPIVTAPGGAAAPRPVQPRSPSLRGMSSGQPVGGDQPVTFTANEVEYDRENGVVTARGRVEAWQGERILRADEFTYNRNTGVATARGNVQMLEPDGQVLFAESAELSNRMRDAVIAGLRGYLAQNGRVAANGARRTNETLFDLARVLYTVCEPCERDPLAPPLWQLRARTATLDRDAGQVRYRDASVMFGGVPLLWTPYLQHPDGSTPRQSGFLSPSFGYTRYLGGFVETPYYWAIDRQQDVLIAPIFSTLQSPNLGVEYRNRMNFGTIDASGSIGYRNGSADNGVGVGYHIFSRGRFNIDETWRAGFDLNRAESQQYLRIWRYSARRYLPTTVFNEGFWDTTSYLRIDARAYQGLSPTDNQGLVPTVLPNIYFDWMQRDSLGGTLTVDTWNFGIYRYGGTSTARLASRIGYNLPKTDSLGGVWTFRMQGDIAGYAFNNLNEGPNYVTAGSANGQTLTGNIRAALDWRMPFVRSAGEWGHQIIEPRVQFVTGPMTGQQTRIPNEDSIDFDFTDANLFSLNRFYGRDRQEGGTRVDAAIRGAWHFPNGGQLESLVGRSYRFQEDGGPFYMNSGLQNQASDWVGRVRFMPVPWLQFLGRTRLDGETFERRLIDLSTTFSQGSTGLTGGYLFASSVPYLTPIQPRNEIYAAVNQRFGEYWRVSAFGRYNIELGRPVSAAIVLAYEDECFLVDVRYIRQFAENPTTGQPYASNNMLLFRVALRTIGDFGFRAL